MNEVVARIARAFFDASLPKNQVYAVTIEHAADNTIKDCYINLHFYRQIGSFIKSALGSMTTIGHNKAWSVSVALKNAESDFVIVKSAGLSEDDAKQILKLVSDTVSPHIEGKRGRGRPKTRERDEEGKVVRSKPNLEKLPAVKKPKSTRTATVPQSVMNNDDLDPHIYEIDGLKPQRVDDHWNSLSAAEMYLRQAYSRPVNTFSQNTWALVFKSYKDKLPEDFKRKYASQLESGREYLEKTFGSKFAQAADIIEAFASSSFRV